MRFALWIISGTAFAASLPAGRFLTYAAIIPSVEVYPHVIFMVLLCLYSLRSFAKTLLFLPIGSTSNSVQCGLCRKLRFAVRFENNKMRRAPDERSQELRL